MEIVFTTKAQADIEAWKQAGNNKIQKKIQSLTVSILESPFTGLGKPEPLKHTLAGLWSRRITREHRYVYEVLEEHVIVHSLMGHYF